MSNNTEIKTRKPVSKWKSAKSGELIKAVVVEMKRLPDFICTAEQWADIGPIDKFRKDYGIIKSQIVNVHHLLLNPEQFPTNAWEG
jgi:hypothetical protein